MSPRKNTADMIADLEAKLAAARAKEESKAATRATFLVDAIKGVDEQIAKANDTYNKTVDTAEAKRSDRLAKLEERRAKFEDELAELALTPSTAITFSSTAVDEV